METNKYFIVNEIDRPYEELIAAAVDGGLKYIHPRLNKWNVMSANNATPLEEFGITLTEENGVYSGVMTGVSRGKYSDGKLCEWQGRSACIFGIE